MRHQLSEGNRAAKRVLGSKLGEVLPHRCVEIELRTEQAGGLGDLSQVELRKRLTVLKG